MFSGRDMEGEEDLVTVVIAAFNAEKTIDATLASARAQTHRRLEIIVVIDGATDGTETLVRRHAEEDPRLVVIVTQNRGFCAARNTGARAGSGAYIAPLDADDIWHPAKIERQLACFIAAGPDLGMVYTLYRRIDAWDNVILDGADTCWSGRIFPALLLYNCIGNGSSMLIRASAFETADSYAMSLNRLGCEDYLLQILISHDWQVGVVPEFLTGYRFVPGSMSRHHLRMAVARLKMLDIVADRLPDTATGEMESARCQYTAELAIARAREGTLSGFSAHFFEAFRMHPTLAVAYVVYRLRDFGFRFVRRSLVSLRSRRPPKFQAMNPRAKYSMAKSARSSPAIRRLRRRNTALFPLR